MTHLFGAAATSARGHGMTSQRARDRLVECQGIAGAGTVAIGRHHRHFPDFAKAFGKHADARRIHAIVIAQQHPHRRFEPRDKFRAADKFSRSAPRRAADQLLEAGATVVAGDATLAAPAGALTTW